MISTARPLSLLLKSKKHLITSPVSTGIVYSRNIILSTTGESNRCYSSTRNMVEDFNLAEDLKNVEHVTKTYLPQVRKLRLQNLRNYLAKHKCSAGLFHDPCHIRYACDASNMTIWHKRNQVRYLLVPANEADPVILFELSLIHI